MRSFYYLYLNGFKRINSVVNPAKMQFRFLAYHAYLPIWPQTGGADDDALSAGLLVRVISQDMNFSISDTIGFDERGRSLLRAGHQAGLVYELDVNLLPEGSYSLSIAPLAGEGRGLL